MTPVFSDSRSDPSPTIAQLLFLHPTQLLELAIPQKNLLIAPRQPVIEEFVSRPELASPAICIQCGNAFFTSRRKRNAKTCSARCSELAAKARDKRYKDEHAEQRKVARAARKQAARA